MENTQFELDKCLFHKNKHPSWKIHLVKYGFSLHDADSRVRVCDFFHMIRPEATILREKLENIKWKAETRGSCCQCNQEKQIIFDMDVGNSKGSRKMGSFCSVGCFFDFLQGIGSQSKWEKQVDKLLPPKKPK